MSDSISHCVRLLTACAVAAAQLGSSGWAAELPPLCPEPQQVSVKKGTPGLDLSLGIELKQISMEQEPVSRAVERLRAALGNTGKVSDGAASGSFICVGLARDWKKAARRFAPPPGMLERAEELPAEGYALRISDGKAWIIGRDCSGTVYGSETLIQLLRAGQVLPTVDIQDYPDTEYRISYVAGGDRLDDRIKKIVRLAVHYKLNMLVFENSAFYHLEEEETRRRVTEVFDHCKAMGIQPIPELQSFGWSQFVLQIDPLCVESLRWKDRRFRFDKDQIARPFRGERLRNAVLRNADLERGETNKFEAWGQDDAGNTIFSDRSGKGSRCLRITRTAPGCSRIWQEVSCAPETYYSLQADMKTEAGGESFLAYFEVYGNKGLGPTRIKFIRGPIFKTTTNWEKRRFRFNSGPSDVLTIYLRIQDGVGTAWFDNVSYDSVPPPPMENVVCTEEMPIEVRSLDGKLYKEDADYEVKPGELRFPFHADAKPSLLRRKPGGAIKPREEVLVSYDWAQPGDITYCPSEPRTHEIMKRAIGKTIEVFRPRFLHIGHDEPRVVNRCTRCKRRGMKAHQLYVEDIIRMHRFAKEADPDVRLMMWADAFRLKPNGKVQIAWFSDEACSFEEAVRDIPKDIVMCPWEYSRYEPDAKYDEMERLQDAGFSITGSNWYDYMNTVAWAKAMERLGQSDKRLGLFLTTWDNRWEALPLTADLMWTLGKPSLDGRGFLENWLKKRYAPFETVD